MTPSDEYLVEITTDELNGRVRHRFVFDESEDAEDFARIAKRAFDIYRVLVYQGQEIEE